MPVRPALGFLLVLNLIAPSLLMADGHEGLARLGPVGYRGGRNRGAGRAPDESTSWVLVASLTDLPPGSALEVRHGHRVYALFRLGDSAARGSVA